MDPISALSFDAQTERLSFLGFQAVSAQPAQKQQTLRSVENPEKSAGDPFADDSQENTPSFKPEERVDRWIRLDRQDLPVSPRTYSPRSLLNAMDMDTSSPSAPPSAPNEDQMAALRDLQARDKEVRRHEQTHAAMLGPYAGAITYTYEIGPDGKAYAVGGSTEIREAAGSSPEEKAARARRIMAAAMAVSNPSGADLTAAAEAARMAGKAVRQMANIVA
jgi:hypothetical protein